MAQYEIAYNVNGRQWETYAETNDIDEAYGKYLDCIASAPENGKLNGEERITEIALFTLMDDGTQERIESKEYPINL